MTRAGRILLILLLLSLPAVAATLDDYSARLERAGQLVNGKLLVVPTESGWEQRLAAQLRDIIPATEKIRWKGGEVTTDNAWLGESLDRLSPTGKLNEKKIILSGISGRLEALAAAAKELTAAVAGSQSKDEEKRKLAEILSRREYQKVDPQEESLFQRWVREFWEWWDRAFPSAPNMPSMPSGLGGLQVGLQVLIFAAVLGLVGFLVYKFAPAVMGRFGGKAREGKSDRVILGERIGADESSSDLFADAERLAREGDLRGAIRKGYVAVLCELGDRRVVRLAIHKTNRDYLRDLRRSGDLYGSMTGLTGTFERSWYGQAPAEAGDWEDFKTGYRQAVSAAGGRP